MPDSYVASSRLGRWASVIAVAITAMALTSACQTIRPSGAPSGRTPVLFVHGWANDETRWDTAVATFKAAGYTSGDIGVISYDTSLSARDAAAKVAAEVDHLRAYTGKAKVDVVSHSYGSMASRYCIELGGCQGKVDHWMSLAGADNGNATAGLCVILGQASCADMAGQTSTIADLQAAWGEITTQGVAVEVQWSPNDGVIAPAEASKNPSPAINVQLPPTLGHNDIPSDPGVLAETLDFLGR